MTSCTVYGQPDKCLPIHDGVSRFSALPVRSCRFAGPQFASGLHKPARNGYNWHSTPAGVDNEISASTRSYGQIPSHRFTLPVERTRHAIRMVDAHAGQVRNPAHDTLH